MTPEAAAALFELVRQYGLPLVILGGLLWLWLTGRVVLGTQLAAMTALFERERVDRIAAEQTLAKFGGASVEVAEAVREALAAVVRKEPPIDPYAERLEGSPRRGR